jgi:pyruvate formate lyase activating enzyme
MDDGAHTRATGVSNRAILDNLARISADGAKIIVRIPVIPGVNNTAENMEKTADFLRGLPSGVESVELLNYHRLGGGKYGPLGMEYPTADLQPLEKAELRALAAPFTAAGIKTA